MEALERHHLFVWFGATSAQWLKKMKPLLFDCIFLVIYTSASVIANEASVANTTEQSTQEKPSSQADKKISV